jgi:predicted dehydrogenase
MAPTADPSRRDFLKASGAVLVGGALAPIASALPGLPNLAVHSQGSGKLKIGLLGCGGRGAGAAANALAADPQTELVAVGDLFADMADNTLKALRASEVGARVTNPEAGVFIGLDAYKGVIEVSDVVLLCTTPAFRPLHLRHCIEKGKHAFVEKPVAVDGPGLRHVLESCRMAREKKLNVVSGLCYRYERKKRATIQRIQDGAVGEIVALQCTYNTGGLWHRGRGKEWSELETQLRNWLYYAWLSGDHIAEQHIHSLDKIAWAMKDEYPVSCVASGGRANRTDPKYGNVYDHFNTVFEWKSGVRLFSSCRQWAGEKPGDVSSDVSDFVFGTKGKANIQAHTIWGEQAWRWKDDGTPDDMYQNEHDALFAALRKGEVIDNGEYMCRSTLMATMGRMSAYTGQAVTAEQALQSTENLGVIGPDDFAKLTLNTAPPPTPLPVPGFTHFR